MNREELAKRLYNSTPMAPAYTWLSTPLWLNIADVAIAALDTTGLLATNAELVKQVDRWMKECDKASGDYLRACKEAGEERDRHAATKADLEAERKKWPDLKAEVEKLKSANAILQHARDGYWRDLDIERTGSKALKVENSRLRDLLNGYTATVSLFEHIVKRRLSGNATLTDAVTGAQAHIAPDVREALDKLVKDAKATEVLRQENDTLAAKNEDLERALAEEKAKLLCIAVLPPSAVTRDRIRLALLDLPTNYGFEPSEINALADHLVEKLK